MEAKDQKDSLAGPLALLALAVVTIQLIAGWAVYEMFDTWEGRAATGDMFGVANTLFSGLAFAGVVYAIILQRRELQLQRNELELTRKELSRTAEAQERSEQAFSAQAASLQLAARLNALQTLVQAMETDIASAIQGNGKSSYPEGVIRQAAKRELYVRELERLVGTREPKQGA